MGKATKVRSLRRFAGMLADVPADRRYRGGLRLRRRGAQRILQDQPEQGLIGRHRLLRPAVAFAAPVGDALSARTYRRGRRVAGN